MDPLSSLMSGGLSFNPSSSSSASTGSNTLQFAPSGGGLTTKQLMIIGGFSLATAYVIGKAFQ